MSENSEETKNENLSDHIKEELEKASKDKDSVIVKALDTPPGSTDSSAPSTPPAAVTPEVTSGQADPPPRETKRVLWFHYNDLSTLKVGGDPVMLTAEDRKIEANPPHGVLGSRKVHFVASRPTHTEIHLEEPKD